MSEIKNIIGKKEVRAATGMSESTVYREERAGRFPKRFQLSNNRVGWFEDEVIEWQKNLQRGPAVFTENMQKGKARKKNNAE